MRVIQSEELRELQMQILDYIDAFCRNNDIKYTISGGTLLGAVRHGGFIPWDDDIDIQMLRNEYDRFTELWNNHENNSPYELVNIESGNNMGYAFGKVHDTRTATFVGALERTGVFIDVFPVDNIINREDFLTRHNKIVSLYKERQNALKLINGENGKSSIKNKLLSFFEKKPQHSFFEYGVMINEIAKSANGISAPLVFEMVSGLRCKNPIPKEVFDDYKDIAFENRIYCSVKDVNLFLSLTFGPDYMTPPPGRKQIGHTFIAYMK